MSRDVHSSYEESEEQGGLDAAGRGDGSSSDEESYDSDDLEPASIGDDDDEESQDLRAHEDSKIYNNSRLKFHAYTIPPTIGTAGLYGASILNFLKHWATIKGLSASERSLLEESLFPPKHPWQWVYLVGSAIGIICIGAGNQYSMAAKLAQLFGFTVAKDKHRSLSLLIDFLNALARAIIAGSSFLALSASITTAIGIGYIPAVGFTGLFFLGNVGAQLSNYSSEKSFCELPFPLAAFFAACCAASKVAYDLALYGNTNLQAPKRLGLTSYPVYAIPNLPLRIVSLTIISIFELQLGYTTWRNYYRKLYKLFCKKKASDEEAHQNENYEEIPEETTREEDLEAQPVPISKIRAAMASALETLEAQPVNIKNNNYGAMEDLETQVKNYSFHDRASTRAKIAGAYRAGTQAVAILGILSSFIVLAFDNPLFYIAIAFVIFLFLFNLLPQISFFSHSNKDLKEMGVEPGSNSAVSNCLPQLSSLPTLFGLKKDDKMNPLPPKRSSRNDKEGFDPAEETVGLG